MVLTNRIMKSLVAWAALAVLLMAWCWDVIAMLAKTVLDALGCQLESFTGCTWLPVRILQGVKSFTPWCLGVRSCCNQGCSTGPFQQHILVSAELAAAQGCGTAPLCSISQWYAFFHDWCWWLVSIFAGELHQWSQTSLNNTWFSRTLQLKLILTTRTCIPLE